MNSTQIIVRDFIIPARIGIYPEEHKIMQNICVNVTMELADYKIAKDSIDQTVSYEHIVNEIQRQAEIQHNLVEFLAEELAQFCLQEKRITSVTVQIEKLQIYTQGRVGCTITRTR